MPVIERKPQVIPPQEAGRTQKAEDVASEKSRSTFSDSLKPVENKPKGNTGKAQTRPQLSSAPPNAEPVDEMSETALLALMQAQVSKSLREIHKTQIETNFKVMESNSKEIVEKLNDQVEKMEKMEQKSLASKILGWIGAALSIIVGVATMIAGGAGVGLIVAGVAAMTLMVLEETGVMADIQKSLSEAIEKSLIKNGMDAAEAKKAASIIATVIITVASIAVTVGPAFVNVGGSAVKASIEVQKLARTTTAVTKAVSGTAEVSSGGMGVSTAMDQKDADMKGVEAASLKASNKFIQDENNELTQDMENLNKMVSNSYKAAMDIINAHIKTQKSIAESMKSNA